MSPRGIATSTAVALLIVAIALAAGAGYFFLQAQEPEVQEEPATEPSPDGLPSTPPPDTQSPIEEQVTVQFTGSTYRTAAGGTSGWFYTGQDADIMLSGIDFNNSGSPLL